MNFTWTWGKDPKAPYIELFERFELNENLFEILKLFKKLELFVAKSKNGKKPLDTLKEQLSFE